MVELLSVRPEPLLFTDAVLLQGHFEAVPYTDSTMRSAYHVRELEVFRLAQLKQPLDIMLSHDWPHAIASHGNIQQLFRAKPHLRADVRISVSFSVHISRQHLRT